MPFVIMKKLIVIKTCKIVSKVDVNGVVETFRVDVDGKIVGPWP